jgi:hypothetical protein
MDGNLLGRALHTRELGTLRFDCSSDCVPLFHSIGGRRRAVSVKMVVSRGSGKCDKPRRIAGLRCRLV